VGGGCGTMGSADDSDNRGL